MAWYRTTLTRKGQVTVPATVRRAMGLKEGDALAFVQEGDIVRLTRWLGAVERTAGVLKSDIPAGTADEEEQAFVQGVAGEVAASMER